MKKHYDNFSTVGRTNARIPPKFTFRNIEDVFTECNAINRAKRITTALRKEIYRLEAIGCTWKRRRHFSKRLRERETIAYNKLQELANTHASDILPPSRASDHTPSKRQRGPEAADDGVADDDDVMSDEHEFNEPRSN